MADCRRRLLSMLTDAPKPILCSLIPMGECLDGMGLRLLTSLGTGVVDGVRPAQGLCLLTSLGNYRCRRRRPACRMCTASTAAVPAAFSGHKRCGGRKHQRSTQCSIAVSEASKSSLWSCLVIQSTKIPCMAVRRSLVCSSLID